MINDTLISNVDFRRVEVIDEFGTERLVDNSESSNRSSSNNSTCYPISNNYINVPSSLSFSLVRNREISLPPGTYHITCGEVVAGGTNTPRLILNNTSYVLSSNMDRTITINSFVSFFELYSNGWSAPNSSNVTSSVENLMISVDGGSYEEYEGCLYGLELYNTIENSFITDNYYINCGVIAIFLALIIIIVNSPFLFIRKVKGN